MTKILRPDSVEEYDRLVAAAAEHQVPVQPFGNYTLLVPNEWKPPRAPKKPEPEPEPEPELPPKPVTESESESSKASKSSRSSKEAG